MSANGIGVIKDVQRRLSAILAADVVGYSRLMGADETGTLQELRRHRRELIEPKIAAHNGRIVKLMGDGALVEFASAVEAVACAVDVQVLMRDRNADIPEDCRIVFRLGINIGDVIIDGNESTATASTWPPEGLADQPPDGRQHAYAHTLLARSRKWSRLRAWGMNVARCRGMARARKAVARKLAVILHSMWRDAADFRYGDQPRAERAVE